MDCPIFQHAVTERPKNWRWIC